MSGITRDEDEKERRIPLYAKVNSAENTKCKKFLLKLKQQETSMEKNLLNWMQSIKLQPQILRLILDNMSDVSQKRQILMDNVRKSLAEIAEDLRSAKSIVNSPEEIQKLDINAYKQQLVRLSQKIKNLKISCQLESLSQEQTVLQSELREFEMNLRNYESAIGSLNKPTSVVSCNKENKKCHDYKDIDDFHALIAKTGHTDNWSNEDHLLFLKLRQKCSNIPALVAAIQVKCPDLTAKTIVNHEAWYKVYLDLREKQRSTVRDWRKRKEMERTKENREDGMTAETWEEILREKVHPGVTGKFPTRTANKCETRIMKTGDVGSDMSRKKELIRRWKVEREKKRSVDEEQLKMLTESKLAAQEKRRRERFKKTQEALAEYYKRKSIKVSSQAPKDDSRAGGKYNPTLIKAFRKQDEEYIKRKTILMARQQRPAKSGTARIVTPQATKMRDCSTLLNPTKIWSERCKLQERTMFGTKEPRKLQYIKDIPRLYIRWRNSESMEIKDALTSS